MRVVNVFSIPTMNTYGLRHPIKGSARRNALPRAWPREATGLFELKDQSPRAGTDGTRLL